MNNFFAAQKRRSGIFALTVISVVALPVTAVTAGCVLGCVVGLVPTDSQAQSAAQTLGALNAPSSGPSPAQQQAMVAEIVGAINHSVHFPSYTGGQGPAATIGPDQIGQFTYRKDGNDMVYCGEVIGMNLPVSYSGWVRFIASGGNATVEHPAGTYMEQTQFARFWNQFCGT